MPYKLGRWGVFLPLIATHLYKCADSIPGLQSTIMSSVTPPQQSNNDGPRPHLVISAPDTEIWNLACLPDGRRVVIGSGDRTVKVWNLESGEQEGTTMEHENEMVDVAVTRDGKTIISSDWTGSIKMWDVESHELVKEWTHPEGCPRIAISPDDRLAVGDGAVAIYTNGSMISSRSAGPGLLSLCVSLRTERNLRVALLTTSACMTSRMARSSLVHWRATKVGSLCCGHATAAGSSVARTTRRFAVGTPIRENKSDIRGEVTPASY